MKRILSIFCIIFLIGITSAVPYYSTSYFVYAEENNEQLTDDEIINAGLAVYLNARNGFITIANGTVSGAKILMNNTIDTFISYYNANQTVENQISKSGLVGNILVNYNPFRVSLKGSAVRFFNNLYSYLESQNKVPNAENSNGGNTTDEIYVGRELNGQLFTVVEVDFTNNFQTKEVTNIQEGSQYPLTTQGLINIFKNNNPTFDFGGGANQTSNVTGVSLTYSANYTANFNLYHLRGSFDGGNYKPALTCFGSQYSETDYLKTVGGIVYTSRVYHVESYPCFLYVKPSNDPPYYAYGHVTHNYSNGKVYVNKSSNFKTTDSTNSDAASFNFETIDFDQTAPTPPEGDDSITYTPKDKTTNNTYNTYNEYINNYVTKNTKIVNNNSGGGSSNNPYPLDPENPSDPGGIVPDWSGNGDSGSLDPDGNGGFTFNLPDFSLPDLDIDWSISGLSEKFPFSIPFDLLAFFTVLNAEPETPAIQATIPLGLWEWEIDWDLHNFDNLAELLRNLEFIGFCIGLALITRNIIKG